MKFYDVLTFSSGGISLARMLLDGLPRSLAMAGFHAPVRWLRNAVIVSMVLTGCDGFNPDVTPVAPDLPTQVEMVRQWYDDALERTQKARIGKFSNAEILEAMVEKYPPDWSKAVSMPIPGNSGATRITTVLGTGLPATTHSHSVLDAIRTISVDVDQDDEVIGSRLLEFVSPDSLSPDDFASYVQQWADRDYGNRPMLTNEYDIAYDSKVSEVYTPGEGFKSVEMTLEETSGAGKTAATTYCWITDVDVDWLCKYESDTGIFYDCEVASIEVEITCVTADDDDGGDGGGGGGDDDGGGSGGGGGGGDDDGDDNGNQGGYLLECKERLQRAEVGECTVKSDSTGQDLSQLTIQWSSSTGAKLELTGATAWTGRATETATIRVSIGSDFRDSTTINVEARTWKFERLNAPVQYSPHLRAAGRIGRYSVQPPQSFSLTVGSGPWEGRYMLKAAPLPISTLEIAADYDSVGPPHPGAGNTCNAASGLTSADYRVVNDTCRTSAAMDAFARQIIQHERHHEKGFSDCLLSSRGDAVMASQEKLVGTRNGIRDRVIAIWNGFMPVLDSAGTAAPAFTSRNPFWYYDPGPWVLARHSGVGHGGKHGCGPVNIRRQ